MKFHLPLAAVLAAAPTHVLAQEAEAPGPQVGGFRIEAIIGTDTDGFESGLLYGGRIGYDLRVSRTLLLGIEGELNDVTTDQEFILSPQQAPFVLEDGPDTYVGGRATVLLSSRFSLHGGAGYTRGRQSFFFLANPSQPTAPIIGGEESFRDGFRLIGGGQFNIGRRTFLGLEYRYSEYEGHFIREQVAASVGFRF